MNKVTGIICAMQKEADVLIADMTEIKRETLYGIEFVCGKLCGADVVLATSGVGKVMSARCTQTMIMKYSPEEIINTGVGGAISDKLKIYDIIIATSLVQHDFDTTPMGEPLGFVIDGRCDLPADAEMIESFSACAEKLGYTYHAGVIATGDQFIADDASKKKIRDNFGAIACEMEGAAIGTVCYMSGVRFAILRSISDSGDGTEFEEFVCEAAKRSGNVMEEYLKSKA